MMHRSLLASLLTPSARGPVAGAMAGAFAPGRWLVMMALVVLVAGCATTPPAEPEPVDVDARAAEAERMLANDRPLGAARIYSELADATEGTEAQRWRLELVELLFAQGYPELALEHHQQLETGPVPAELELRKRVTDAQAAVARQQNILALRLLPDARPGMPAAVRARIHGTRAQAYAQSGQPGRALRFWIRAETALEEVADADAIAENHERIWTLLDGMDREALEIMVDEADSRIERGWGELALAERAAASGRRPIDTAFADWQQRYPRHPAAEDFADTLRERVIDQLTYPPRIDVLLPLSGDIAEAAAAIRDGIMTVYYDTPDYIQQPEVVFHDVGADGVSVEDAYATAVEADSGFVIGPLRRSSVDALVRDRRDLPVPVLTLNYLGEGSPDAPAGFYQFGLAPEDEARQAAKGAIGNGRFNALVLTPSNDWGDRLLRAFTDRFEELGGVVVETSRYNPNASDYGNAIQSLLNIDDSYARNRLVRSTIGRATKFEPRRRDDAEVIFLAARPREARLAKPQLEFHRIGDIPVYATSHVFSGEPDPDDDWDMNGLFFTEIPWILDQIGDDTADGEDTVDEGWPDSQDRFPRLFALGADAFEVLPLLEQLQAGSGDAHDGRTGRLTVNDDGRIERQLRWALFTRGLPEPVDTPAVEVESMLGAEIRERADDED